MLTVMLVFFAPPAALLLIGYFIHRRRGSTGTQSPHTATTDQILTSEQLKSGPIHEHGRR